MEPGQDFRNSIALSTDIIVTTLDQGISWKLKLTVMASKEWHGGGLLHGRMSTRNHESVLYENIRQQANRSLPGCGEHTTFGMCMSNHKKSGVSKSAQKRQLADESPSNDRYDFESVLDEIRIWIFAKAGKS